ncbi:NAD(P)/FAD-dependent oxidoreductase [Fulvivirgaceae bacterium LMO-SS25]
MNSIWEKESWLKYDIAIIGAGIVGLSTAISIKELAPNTSVVVLERGILPTGASTRNAGFACFGSLSELLIDIEKLGEAGAFALVEKRWKGLQKLRARLGDEAIGYQAAGGYELLREDEGTVTNHIASVNDLLKPLFNEAVFHEKSEVIHQFGFDKQQVKGLIWNPFEGHIHTGKMMKSLLILAQQKGVIVHFGAEVNSWERSSENEFALEIRDENTQAKPVILAEKLICCTNAFTSRFFPNLAIEPGRGVVMLSKPLENLPFRGAFHFDEGYFYFRDLGNRILFGGGRNIFYKQEKTTQMEVSQNVLDLLLQHLNKLISPKQKVELDFAWSGIMAFGPDKSPLVGQLEENLYAGVRLGGMGVAIGSSIGEELAQMALGKINASKIPTKSKEFIN